ncbi:MAG: response regulator [Chloroflexi bacterium]|nr:response regulator [Chloroflexota bacterium]MDA8186797.1 response regulator [Dehalococcoidales bacterium]
MTRVLVVDDDVSVAKLLATLLSEEGFEAIPITSGQRALEVARGTKLDVILLDLMMPVVSGSMVCEQLKADDATKHVPVIIISGDGRVEEKARHLGATDFILKPFDLDDVVNRVRKCCGDMTKVPADV